MEIDLKSLEKNELPVADFILLQMIHEGINPNEYTWGEDIDWTLSDLEESGYVKILGSGDERIIELRQKAVELFVSKSETINFDEFWEAFPAQTPNGRALRSVNKEFAGSLTTNYKTAKEKYLRKVKQRGIHDQIVAIVKARVASRDYEYMNNIETYINRAAWQVDIKYLNSPKYSDFAKEV